MATWLWILIIIIVVVLIALVAAMAARRRRTEMLRERFGPEYDRAVNARENQRAAEAELRGREREHARLDIRPLPEASRARYTEEWRAVQQSFVDQPAEATVAGYDLVNRVMAERGYPMRDFEARAGLVSVDHPDVVENYRVAHGIHERAMHQQATTEDLREALLRYRSLFEELLRPDGHAEVPAGRGSARPGGGQFASGEPASGEPASGEPGGGQFASGEPASGEPASGEPASGEPVSQPARGEDATQMGTSDAPR